MHITGNLLRDVHAYSYPQCTKTYIQSWTLTHVSPPIYLELKHFYVEGHALNYN